MMVAGPTSSEMFSYNAIDNAHLCEEWSIRRLIIGSTREKGKRKKEKGKRKLQEEIPKKQARAGSIVQSLAPPALKISQFDAN